MAELPGGRRRRRSRDDVRRAILDSAARVLAERGVDGASLDDVAAGAGFTKGAVYSNFGSKAGLIDALVAEGTATYVELGLEAVSDLDGTMQQRARALGDRLTGAFTEYRDWHLVFFELWQRAVRSGDVDDVLREQRNAMRTAVTAAIEDHADRTGAVLPLPAPELAVVFMALANGLAVERMATPDDIPVDLMGRVMEMLVTERRD